MGDGKTPLFKKVHDLLVIESEVDSGDMNSINMDPLMQKVYELLTARNLVWVHRDLGLICTILMLEFFVYLRAEFKVECVVTGLKVDLVIHLANPEHFNAGKEQHP